MMIKSEKYDRVIDELEKRLGIRGNKTTKSEASDQRELERKAIDECYAAYEAYLKQVLPDTARVEWKLMAKAKQTAEISKEAGKVARNVNDARNARGKDTGGGVGKLGSSDRDSQAKSAAKQASGAAKLPGMGSATGQLSHLTGLAGGELMGLVNELGQPIVTDLGTSLVPLVSEFNSGAKAFSNWVKTAGDLRRQRKAMRNAEIIRGVSDARAAAKAVVGLIQRERNQHATEASIRTAQFTATVASDFAVVDGGQTGRSITAAIAAGARLAHRVYLFGRDYSEASQANRIIEANAVDRELLATCPLLGAYIVANCDTSYLCGLLAGPNGRSQMSVDAMEQIIREHIWPLQKEARRYIRESDFIVQGMGGSDKGNTTWESDLGFIARIKHRVKKKFTSQVTDPIKKKLSGAKKAMGAKFK